MNPCHFAAIGAPGPCRHRADGRPDFAHWIPKQRIRIALERRSIPPAEWDEIIWDTRVYCPACRRHHGLFDAGFWRPQRAEDYPESLREWARDHDFYFNGPREGWRARYRGRDDGISEEVSP